MQWGSGLVGIDQLSSSKNSDDRKTFFGADQTGDSADLPERYLGRSVLQGCRVDRAHFTIAECSGARDMRVPGEYTEILKTHANDNSPVQTEIEKDITRTFPGNLFFGMRSHCLI